MTKSDTPLLRLPSTKRIAVVVAVVIDADLRLMHVVPSKRKTHELPGGKVMRDDVGLIGALQRELREETGYIANPSKVQVLGSIYDWPVIDKHFGTGNPIGSLVDFHVFRVLSPTPPAPDWRTPEEIDAVNWFGIDEIPWDEPCGGAHRAIVEMVRFHGQGGRFGVTVADAWRER